MQYNKQKNLDVRSFAVAFITQSAESIKEVGESDDRVT